MRGVWYLVEPARGGAGGWLAAGLAPDAPSVEQHGLAAAEIDPSADVGHFVQG
jgi:hypothetical protein